MTRVSAALRRALGRPKKGRFVNAQVKALRLFCSVDRCASQDDFWAQNACQSGVIF
ncbi:hypothetical protein HMPREF9248_1261 [Fannyhessea vaginae PB189-T1-4]|uniref:Uncharacterized protein n=1 Tax=Fannyhessea vaginae PB189-T1-4 TaxID=866774 RepID=A0ABP2J389_9ACTN|nr:hypothetical protein HMPREF9248_1261 [Fannyhessea vaginae PB189-T1-4]